MDVCDFFFDEPTGQLIFIPSCYGSIHRGFEGCTCGVELEERMRKVLRPLVDAGKIEQSKKCCGKCAFRKNSPERCDPYGWMTMSETLSGGSPFVCHEGLPDHQHSVDGAKVKLCAGWKAMQGKPIDVWMKLAYTDDRLSDARFE